MLLFNASVQWSQYIFNNTVYTLIHTHVNKHELSLYARMANTLTNWFKKKGNGKLFTTLKSTYNNKNAQFADIHTRTPANFLYSIAAQYLSTYSIQESFSSQLLYMSAYKVATHTYVNKRTFHSSSIRSNNRTQLVTVKRHKRLFHCKFTKCNNFLSEQKLL